MVRYMRARRRCLVEVGIALVVGSSGAVHGFPEAALAVGLLGFILVLAAGQ